MMAFNYFSAAVLLSFSIYVPTVIADSPLFTADLDSGNKYVKPGSGITWHTPLNHPNFGACDWQGIIRVPFASDDCYRFELEFDTNPSGFNFHIANGCGDGWGGSSGCYEVHSYKKTFYVYGKTGSGDSTRLINGIGPQVELIIEKGRVQFTSNGITQTVNNPTLFTANAMYFSMNRVWNLQAFPNPLRVALGLCKAKIYTC